MARHADPASDFARLTDCLTGVVLKREVLGSKSFQHLVKAGLIERAPEAKSYACPSCAVTHPIERAGADYVVICDTGPKRLKPEAAHAWRCHWGKLKQVMHERLSLAGPSRELIPGTACFLGMLGKSQIAFPVWLVRGMTDPNVRLNIIQRLEIGGPQLTGVVITASKLMTPPAIANGSKFLWLADLIRLEEDQVDFDLAAVWSRAPEHSRGNTGKKGRPGKEGDPLATFLSRVKAQSAEKMMSKEAMAILKIEIALHGRKKAYARSSIENLIRDAFNAWKERNFPVDFRWPEKAD
jgi:hypothetical protein